MGKKQDEESKNPAYAVFYVSTTKQIYTTSDRERKPAACFPGGGGRDAFSHTIKKSLKAFPSLPAIGFPQHVQPEGLRHLRVAVKTPDEALLQEVVRVRHHHRGHQRPHCSRRAVPLRHHRHLEERECRGRMRSCLR